MQAYTYLHLFTLTQPQVIRVNFGSMGPVSAATPTISDPCAYRLEAFLILFNFDGGDLIYWLGGVYTHAHIPFDPIRTAVAVLRHCSR